MPDIAIAPTLETARLRLRAFDRGHGDPVAALLADPIVTHFLHIDPIGREDAWRRLLSGAGLWAMLGYGYWAVERKEDGLFLGQVGFADFRREIEPSLEGIPEMGWMFAGHAHGQGYATEAAIAALGWADEVLAAPEFAALIGPGNAASINVALKAGFRETDRTRYKGDEALIFRR